MVNPKFLKTIDIDAVPRLSDGELLYLIEILLDMKVSKAWIYNLDRVIFTLEDYGLMWKVESAEGDTYSASVYYPSKDRMYAHEGAELPSRALIYAWIKGAINEGSI